MTISPLVERIVDASIPLPVVDWSNYKNIPKEEEICVQLNAQAINAMLSTLSAEVLDEAIFNGQTPPESAHLIWTRLVDLYGKSKCDDVHELKSMKNMSIVSSCNEETTHDLKRIRPKQEVQAMVAVLSDSKYWTCLVLVPDVFSMA
jgi:hypothetical protein